MTRLDFLQAKENTQLSLGPYPYKDRKHGWLTFDLNDADWAVCYKQRKDYKLGLKFKYIRRHDSNEGSTPEKPVSMEVKFMQETFDLDNH